MELPLHQQLEEAYQEAERIHKTHLTQYDVHLPRWPRYKAIHLAMLMHNLGKYVHKDVVSDAVQSIDPQAGRDQQVRHLKRDGWNIESDGKGRHRITDPYNPSPEYTASRTRRQGRITADDFDSLVKLFGNRCATCGAINGEPDPRYGGRDKVSLQRGHMKPYKPIDQNNIIPQCQFCNQAYKDDFEFDERGRVIAVANTRPVKRARRSVQEKIYKYLKDLLD